MNAIVLALLSSAALSGGTKESTIYTDYREAWSSAQSRELPLLVILNPGSDSEPGAVDMDLLYRTSQRRELLAQYVVVRIDGGTPKGKRTLAQFGSPKELRLSVIDRKQRLQIHRGSPPATAEDWNLLLAKYQAGVYIPPPAPPVVALAPARPGVPASQCFT